MFICIQKVNFISNFFFEKLYWELWKCLTIPSKNLSIKLKQSFMLICMQKINCITHFFLKMLQRNSKLFILGNLGMPGHIYQQIKNQLHPSLRCYRSTKLNAVDCLISTWLSYPKQLFFCLAWHHMVNTVEQKTMPFKLA